MPFIHTNVFFVQAILELYQIHSFIFTFKLFLNEFHLSHKYFHHILEGHTI